MKASNQSGFSLLEILIALTLLAIMMTYIFKITNDGINIKDSILSEDEEYFAVQMALNRMSIDFGYIYNPLYFSNLPRPKKTSDKKKSSNGKKVSKIKTSKNFPKVNENGLLIPTVDAPDKESLTFLSFGNQRKIMDIKQSNFSWIKYTLRTTEQTPEKEPPSRGEKEIIRYIQAENIYETNLDWDEVSPQVLLDNVKDLKLSFWHNKRKDFVDSMKELPQNDKLIRGIKLKLVWISPSGNEKEFSRIIVPLWPHYDAIKDKKEKWSKEKKKKSKNKTPR